MANKKFKKFKEKAPTMKARLEDADTKSNNANALAVQATMALSQYRDQFEILERRVTAMEYRVGAIIQLLRVRGISFEEKDIEAMSHSLQHDDFMTEVQKTNAEEGVKLYDGKAETGDVLVFKLTAVDEAGVAKGSSGHARIIIGSGEFRAELEEKLIGMTKGESKVATVAENKFIRFDVTGVYRK